MKFKHAESPGWYYQIDQTGNKSQSFTAKNKPGLYAEMMAWVKAGNEVEPQFTAEELAAKEAEELAQAIKSQQSTCVRLLKDSDEKVNGAYPNTDEDKAAWELYRAELRKILKSDTIQPVPEKPFS